MSLALRLPLQGIAIASPASRVRNLRARIKRLGLTYVDAAPKLGQATRAQRGQHQAELSRMQRSRRRIGQL